MTTPLVSCSVDMAALVFPCLLLLLLLASPLQIGCSRLRVELHKKDASIDQQLDPVRVESFVHSKYAVFHKIYKEESVFP